MSLKHPQKRVIFEKQEKYAHVAEIQAALRQESLTEALTTLRNQFTVKSQENTLSPQDEKLTLAKRWADASPGLKELFDIWEKAHSRQPSQVALILSLISGVLALLSFHYNDYALGQPIMKTLLAPICMRKLNSYIGGSQNELIIVTLKLFNVMSGFAGGRDRKSVLEGFGWEIKSLPKLLNMRRRGDDSVDPLVRPDIRVLYILLLLSFVDVNSTTQIKTTFLEQHRDAFLAIFKGIVQDRYSLARRILEICWGGIWADAKLKRTLKIGLFSEATIAHLVKLYDRAVPEDNDEDHIPANLVHHFLLAICTRPGIGICFKDRGWYPKDTDGDDAVPNEEDFGRKSGKIYNKILANVIKTLKVNEDSRQQELALKVLAACPELVAGYWSQVSLTLEPRLSSKWITNIAVFGSIISLPIPISSFYLPQSQLYQPTPPPLSTIMENILPSVNTKINFSKGLQSPSGLVQHCTALALSKCLLKYRATDEHVAQIAATLEEDEEDGQWSKRRREMGREVRRRVPEFQVIVAFSQQKQTEPAPSGTVSAPNPTKVALLAESAQRLLWLYHRCVPSVVAEARFDVGKLLHTFSAEPDSGDDVDSATSRLRQVQQLHVLNLLRESDQFVWSGKTASLANTPLYILLRTLTSTTLPSIKKATSALLQHILSSSILFQEDPNEPSLWLSALPRSRARAKDDSISKDEAEGVVLFLDDCVHRCLKTPYRYIEELQSVPGPTSNANLDLLERPDAMPSPLLMTVLEQLQAKISTKFFSPSQALGVVTFVRKLLYCLASKVSNLAFLRDFTDKLDFVLDPKHLFVDSPGFSGAIRREVMMLHESLSFRPYSISTESGIDPELNQFLDQIEENAVDESNAARTAAAEGVLDWVRTQHTQRPLGTLAFGRIATLVASLCPSLILELLQFTIPGEADIWNALNNISSLSQLRPSIGFEWLYIHCRNRELLDDRCRATLTESVFTTPPTNAKILQTFNLIMHTMVAIGEDGGLVKAHLSLLAQILRVSKTVLSIEEIDSLKETFLGLPGVLRDLMMSSLSPDIVKGLQEILHVIADSSIPTDRRLVSDIATHWLSILESTHDDDLSRLIPAACTWIRYLESNQLFSLLDHIAQNPQGMPTSYLINLANVALEALHSMAISDPTFEEAVQQQIPLLLSLDQLLQQSLLVEKVIALSVVASLPLGLDGSSLSSAEFSNSGLTNLLQRSHTRWNRRSGCLSTNIDIETFLKRDMFSDATISIITGLIYLQPASRCATWAWLTNPDSRRREARHLIPILHALVDSSSSDLADSMDVVLPLLPCVIVAMTSSSPANLRGLAYSCISRLLSASDLDHPSIFGAISSETQKLSNNNLSLELVLMGSELATRFGQAAQPILAVLVDCGLQWFIDNFADNYDSAEAISLTQSLVDLIQSASVSKPHLVETVLAVVVQGLFINPVALSLATASVKTTQLKPVIVNRHLQTIIQHPQFYRISTSPSAEHTQSREALLELLYTLFHLHPNNTCQVTHIEPLIRVYHGTLASADLRILSIFQLFETHRKLSVASILARWSTIPGTPSETSLEALRSLDPIVVLRTCLSFPRRRRLTSQAAIEISVADASLYDPVFLMLLFGQMLQDHPPSSNFAWIELFRTNVVSLFIRGLSSKDEQIRELSIAQIVGLWNHIEGADIQERAHVIYVLDILKNTLKATPDSPPSRLPSYTTLTLMHALRGIFYPSNFIYPLTARFLLQRPELDITDVPLLYGMLYSSSDDWKKERGWIIRFLSDGMMSTADWRVLKRRHTWDLLGSLYQSADNDQSLRHGILDVLANLTCNQQATTSLLLKSALLSWIEIQLFQSTVDGLEWIRIIENVLVVVDSPKIERSTNGEWRSVICRCLSYLLDKETCSAAVANFPYALPVILRLSLLEGAPPMDLNVLLQKCLLCMEDLEAKIILDAQMVVPSKFPVPSPPHHASSLHRLSTTLEDNCLGLWGWCVELLWRASMSVPESSSTWNQLVHRLLGWRSFVGPDKSLVGEWARREVVSNLSSDSYSK